MNNALARKNAATFARCQARYDAMESPDYWQEDPPPCWRCQEESELDDEDGLPVCESCYNPTEPPE